MDDKRISFGGAIKAVGDGIVEGYLISFTDETKPDLYEEWFDQSTDLHINEGYPITGISTLYHHGLDDTIGIKSIGRVVKSEVSSLGAWVQAQLDLNDEYQAMIYKLAQDGKLGWSSGALPQSVRVAENGHIDSWAVIEASLTPTPAMPFNTRISTLKALQGAINNEPGTKEPGENPSAKESGAPTQSQPTADGDESGAHKAAETDLAESKVGVLDMDEQQLRDLIMAILADYGITKPSPEVQLPEEAPMMAAMQAAAVEGEALPEEDKMKAVVAAGFKAYNESVEKRRTAAAATVKAMGAEFRNQPGVSKTAAVGLGGAGRQPQISVSETLKYAHRTAEEMALALKMMVAMRPTYEQDRLTLGDVVSEEFARHLAHKVASRIQNAPEPKYQTAIQDREYLKAVMPFKANELDAVAITNQGSQWPSIWYDSNLWEYARSETKLLNELERKGMRVVDIPQGSRTMNVKLSTGSPTVYTRSEPQSVDATGHPEVTAAITPWSTSEVAVDPAEHVLAVSHSHVLEEDSFIDVASFLNNDITVTMGESLESTLINGDTVTTASTNINLIDGTPGTGLQKPNYLAWNGIRKQFVLTYLATQGLDNAAAALDITDFEQIIMLFPAAIVNRRDNMLFIMDYKTESATRKLPELLTVDVAGETKATMFAGKIPPLFGVDPYMSGFLGLSNGDGKISATASNNVKGTLAVVYAPYWQYGRKRAMTIETERSALAGATTFVASIRHILVARGANAANGMFDILV